MTCALVFGTDEWLWASETAAEEPGSTDRAYFIESLGLTVLTSAAEGFSSNDLLDSYGPLLDAMSFRSTGLS